MKSKVINGVWIFEPETDQEANEIQATAYRWTRRVAVTEASVFPANHSPLPTPAHSRAD